MWGQGEHLTIVGMTGSGKTTLERDLLAWRRWAVMLVTKPDDLVWRGWKRIRRASEIDPARHERYRLEPPWPDAGMEFLGALEVAWAEGGWAIVADEVYHLEHLGLRDALIRIATQGRAKRITLVSGVQRPAWVSRFVLSEATHLFSFRLGDRRDLRALSDGVSDAYAEAVAGLGTFEYAYIDKRAGRIETGRREDLERFLGPRPAPAAGALTLRG